MQTHGVPDLQGFYTALHDVFSQLDQDASAALDAALQEHRALTRQIRELLRASEEAEDALFVALSQARGSSAEPPLRGARLGRVAAQILSAERGNDPIHYRDWFQLARDANLIIAGKDELATFLTAITRNPQVERVGGTRTGVYRITGGAS